MDKSSARTLRIPTLALAMALFGCSSREVPAVPAASTKISWGNTPEGQPVELYTLMNAKGSEARIMTYGGVVVSLKVPDRSGALGDVVAGFDNLQGYLTPPPYFGAIIGRYGNRIGGGQFSLGGVAYPLATTLPRMDVGRLAMGQDVKPDYSAIPHATYTDPPTAGVGLQLEQATEQV